MTNEFRWGIRPALPAHWHNTINVNQFEVVISAESIEAKAEDDGKTDAMQAAAEAIIEAIAREISLREKASYKVRLGSFSQFNSDTQQRSATVFVPSPPAIMAVMGRAEVLITDAKGTVIRDTHAE